MNDTEGLIDPDGTIASIGLMYGNHAAYNRLDGRSELRHDGLGHLAGVRDHVRVTTDVAQHSAATTRRVGATVKRLSLVQRYFPGFQLGLPGRGTSFRVLLVDRLAHVIEVKYVHGDRKADLHLTRRFSEASQLLVAIEHR